MNVAAGSGRALYEEISRFIACLPTPGTFVGEEILPEPGLDSVRHAVALARKRKDPLRRSLLVGCSHHEDGEFIG